MLSILGRPHAAFCDRQTRREFLRLGALGLGGLSLPQLLRAEAQAGIKNSHKSVIMVFLSGGPPHQDMVDLKPDAPAEIRGEFKPIATALPGFQVCEHLPRTARQAHRLAVLRAVNHNDPQHNNAGYAVLTGTKPALLPNTVEALAGP